MEPIIEINHLSYAYQDGHQALKDVSLHVHRGEKVALIGANGAGKSTLLLHLNGILNTDDAVQIDGLSMKKENLNRIRGLVGLVFQNPDDQLFSSTVLEDVAYGPLYQGLEKHLIQQRVLEALDLVHMSGYLQRNPYHLSGGEKKRIAMATVLSMKPEILAFDEPTAGLDPRSRRELIELLIELPQSMILATHDLGLVERLTPRTVILNQGRITVDGRTVELLNDSKLLDANGLL